MGKNREQTIADIIQMIKHKHNMGIYHFLRIPERYREELRTHDNYHEYFTAFKYNDWEHLEPPYNTSSPYSAEATLNGIILFYHSGDAIECCGVGGNLIESYYTITVNSPIEIDIENPLPYDEVS